MQRDTRDVHTERKSHRKTQEKSSHQAKKREANSVGILVLDFSASRDVRIKCLLFYKYSSWNSVMTLLETLH